MTVPNGRHAPTVRHVEFTKEKGEPRGLRPVMLARHPGKDAAEHGRAPTPRQGAVSRAPAIGLPMVVSDSKTFKLFSNHDHDAINAIIRHIEMHLAKDHGETMVRLRKAQHRLVRYVASRYRTLGWQVRLYDEEGDLVISVSHPELVAVPIEHCALDQNAVREVDASSAPAATG
ncbi:hypothetical protein [Polyangium sp. 15x6]|uniref:hypothetical protein n=1 Tax=Polyangium sp. 15x6 TaxID=3042687 RepID=UPI00249A24E0|nr:hypothetical protein [Polyangium sp. 15x6]MDI3291016.1 hypothetical protein [Polyangium sp. 15x6]